MIVAEEWKERIGEHTANDLQLVMEGEVIQQTGGHCEYNTKAKVAGNLHKLALGCSMKPTANSLWWKADRSSVPHITPVYNDK